MEQKRKVDIEKDFYLPDMFNRFIKESNPGVCVTGKFNVTKIYKHKKKYSFNAMLLYCIQQAAQKIEAFHYMIKEDGAVYFYKNMKTNAVIFGKDSKHYYVDYAYNEKFADFMREYESNNALCREKCQHYVVDSGSLIATSALIDFPYESISLATSEVFWDNFIMWGKFVKSPFKVKLNISLRFHHALVDGKRASLFFNELQNQLNNFNPKH